MAPALSVARTVTTWVPSDSVSVRLVPREPVPMTPSRSELLGLGVPPRTVMEIAGHSGLEMTMNVYGHVTLDEKREALDKLGELFEEDEK